MGQCMSRKAAGAFAASAAVSHNRPAKMQKHQKLVSPEEDGSPTAPLKPRAAAAASDTNRRCGQATKGVAMSFGFKRRGAPSIAANATAARRLASVDGNGNAAAAASDADPLTDNAAPTGRTTPRLAPPKKEAGATRINRFGFRQTPSNRQNKIADLNHPSATEFGAQNNPNNNALTKKPAAFVGRSMAATGNDNNNKNRMVKVGTQQPQVGKYTLQTTQLPRPESVRLIETKTAKTLANNNKRVACMYQYHNQEETSSKDGSLTEDSGVGSNRSGFMGEVEQLEASPNFGARRRNGQQRARNLEMVVTSKNTFDVIDRADSNGSCETIPPPPLPQLPSAFRSSMDNKDMSYHPTGLVRERAMEYQRHLSRDNRERKISMTSSEGFSDDYGEEKNYREAFRSEKVFVKAVPSHQAFLKSRGEQKEDSSPASSDEHEWAHGGEAMADEISFSLSSSDESRDKQPEDSTSTMMALQSLIERNFASNDLRNVTLTIEDQKLGAIVAAQTACLLDEETLISPSDSVSYSETEEIKKKFQCSPGSDSKEVNEKLTPSSPGTPTNASNSLSLSDGKDDFLIDDEIADQPALVFEDGVKNDLNLSQNNSEATPTLVDSTPKLRRRSAFEASPLRSKKFLHSRTGSLDTLSPCESINSDDMMMDYEYSQSSGLEEYDKQSSSFPSLNDAPVSKSETSEIPKAHKDWSVLLGNYVNPEKSPKSHASRPRLLRSRAGTPGSAPDSPRSLDNRPTNPTRISRPSANGSPAKSRILSSSGGYDSDDSIRLDRANHTAIKQDIMSMKTMLLKLKRVMNETDEDMLMRSETHNPFESQAALTNGLFNGLHVSDPDDPGHGRDDGDERATLELAELRRQVLFLQGQLEDKEKTVRTLQEQVVRLANDDGRSNSAPASTASHDGQTCNAATQTERLRPISAGPSFFNGPSVDGSALVSATEPNRRPECALPTKRPPSRLWRRPGEPPSPQRYNTPSSIPRRAKSRPRPPAGDPHAA